MNKKIASHENRLRTRQLHEAVRNAPLDAVRALLAVETDVDRTDKIDRTALMVASVNGHAAIVKLLLAAGADVDNADKYGWTALIDASGRGHIAVVRALLAAGADVDRATDRGWTALIHASYFDHAAIVRTLLAAGADVNRATNVGWTALMEASQEGHTAIVALLEDAKGIRARHLLGKWRAATRLWRLTNWWWRVAGEGQHAPDMPGRKRARAEFEADCAA
jgi:ankyrin repeat protein